MEPEQISSRDVDQVPEEAARHQALALSLAGPWRRFTARFTDMVLLSLIVGLGFDAVLDPDTLATLMPNEIMTGIVRLPFILLLEAMVMPLFGNTFGKAVLGIRVVSLTGTPLKPTDHFSRAFGVYLYGLAANLPLIQLYALYKQHEHVSGGHPTSYDRERFSVRAREIGAVHKTIAACAIVGAAVLPGLLAKIGKLV